MSSVFGTGQSTNSMASIMKANQISKVCASSHEYPHAEKKIKKLHEQNFKGMVAGPSRLSREKNLSSGQKEKLHGKKKNLTAKTKTSRQKEKPHGKKEWHGIEEILP